MIQIYIYPTHTHILIFNGRDNIVNGMNNGILSIHIYILLFFFIFTELFLICMLLQCYSSNSSNSVKQNTKFYFYPLHPF